MEFFHFCNGLCYNWQEAITLNFFHIIPFYWVVWPLFSIKDLKEFRNGFFFCPAMLCGRFYMPSLLVTVARGSKVPGAACSPFQSALTNHLLKWRTIMTTINLKRYYPYMTENVMLEVSDEIAATLSMGGRLCDSYKRQKRRNGECSLDTDPGFEADVLRQPMTPDEYIEARETTFALYDALTQLPPTQARRVYQHYLLGMSKAEIAAAEGVGRSRICCSIERGLAAMKNILKKSL